jgi:hypothetical protein
MSTKEQRREKEEVSTATTTTSYNTAQAQQEQQHSVSPRHLADNYARVVSSYVDNTIAVTRVANNAVFANMEAFKTSIQSTRDNVREFSRISVNSARTFEQTSRDTTTRFSY